MFSREISEIVLAVRDVKASAQPYQEVVELEPRTVADEARDLTPRPLVLQSSKQALVEPNSRAEQRSLAKRRAVRCLGFGVCLLPAAYLTKHEARYSYSHAHQSRSSATRRASLTVEAQSTELRARTASDQNSINPLQTAPIGKPPRGGCCPMAAGFAR